jgi:hypothetical protein
MLQNIHVNFMFGIAAKEITMKDSAKVADARVVVADHGEIHAFVTPEVMYDLPSCQEVIRKVVGIYHPLCCSGMNIVLKLAVAESSASK